MKTRITLVLAFLITSISFAQQGINYKALIKDSSGNVVANDLIQVQFTILQGAGLTNVYQETHTPTTDANGIVIVTIGEGTKLVEAVQRNGRIFRLNTWFRFRDNFYGLVLFSRKYKLQLSSWSDLTR